jgi:murein DD-endopeptidase MepM/ murein hydrolase activator NlpD
MRLRSATSPSFSRYRLTILLGLAALTAGCSSESNRFSDVTFSNPFASKPAAQQSAAAGPIEQRPTASAQIDTRPLPQPQYQQSPSYSRNAADITGSVAAPAPQRPARSAALAPASAKGKWHWDGGTAVTVAPGDSLETLSHRHGVPTAEIARANGFTSHTPLYPGQRVVIPRYVQVTTSVATSSAPAARAPAPPQVTRNASPQNPVVHVVNPGETLAIIAKRYNRPLAQIAAANNIARDKAVRVGERLIIPGNYAAIAVPAPAPAQSSASNQRMASTEPTNSARVITPAKETSAGETAAAAGPMGATPQFRWPVRGRVIAGFGPKPTGQQNDGINLAVPEGTPVKAADDGVVAYAGNELKGYGNLVLVRHASGFVTAYAHASELLVKRGDPIKRGQVIARSGQTGNVTSPQLHFEIRKGSSPIDPMQYLTGAT